MEVLGKIFQRHGRVERTGIKSQALRGMRGSDLPPEFYVPLVDSLYQEGRTLLVGFFMVTGSILLTFWKTGELLLLACAVAFTVIAAARAMGIRAYARIRDTVKTVDTARPWANRYGAGAASALAVLGAWCFVAFAWTNDPVAQLVSFSISIAYVIGITGRNFGDYRLVIVQILCVAVPMMSALLLYGNAYHWAFAGLLLPFFVAVVFICERLRRNLLDAVVSARDVSLLADRFDTALNNMPHGLCMFDSDRNIVVANQRLSEQLGLPQDIDLMRLSPRELINQAVGAGLLTARDADRLAQDLEERIASGNEGVFLADLQDDRVLEFTAQPMEPGGLVLLVEDVTARTRAEAKINHMARFDALTGLPNRAILRNHMEALLADRSRGPCAIHFIDLDQFKQVNDTLGHSRGDMLLQAVSDRLRTTVRQSDVIARFGGDEFVILQTPIGGAAEASSLAERILQVVGAAYDIDGNQVAVSASIGITFAPHDGTDADKLLRNADLALYRAKSESRDTWRFFKPEMESDAQARRNLELDLRNALANDAFDVYYQPIVDLRTRRILACEALLRWPHPERGMISPAEFIPVAEEMGIITEIDKRVLRKACQDCRQWPDDIAVAVNFSPIQFSRTNVPLLVRQTLAAVGLQPGRLEVEITETTLLQDTARTRVALQQLQSLGVRVSLDDFGTKYSSLSYLHSFPLHKVKIDQSFVKDLTDNERMTTLLRGVARLSAELGLRVAVEGIETEQQLALVAAQDSVDEVQGYLFGRPVPASAIQTILFAGQPPRVGKVA
jgi:diguanylate cyclase (GGDEF)-like protein